MRTWNFVFVFQIKIDKTLILNVDTTHIFRLLDYSRKERPLEQSFLYFKLKVDKALIQNVDTTRIFSLLEYSKKERL